MAQRPKSRPTISTHVLDVETGMPAEGVSVVLFRRGEDDEFEVLAESETDADGRIGDLVGGPLTAGDYQLLMQSIREQVMTLPDETKLYSGHGPVTTVGEERRFNPFVAPMYGGSFA